MKEHDIIDDMIWMSCRYCIGRHTITAAVHAPNLAQFIAVNDISKQQRQFYAKDILSSINDDLHWHDDVIFDGICEDAFGILFQQPESKNTIYIIDRAGKVSTEEGEVKNSFRDDYMDLIPWYKLAMWLKGGDTISWPAKDGEMRSVDSKTYEKNPFLEVYKCS